MILHVAHRSGWEVAPTGSDPDGYSPAGLEAEGFIHLCVGRQLRGVLRRFFAGAPDLVLLGVDETRLDPAQLRWEPGGDDRFPHLHGRLPRQAVTAVATLPDRPELAVALPPAAARLCAAATGDESLGVVAWPVGGGMSVTTDPAAVDRPALHAALGASYWSPGLPRQVMDAALDASLGFSALDAGGAFLGFCRLVTDSAVHAHLVDVIVLPEHRGRGVGSELVRCALDHPALQGLRRWTLDTRDAQGLYARFGFADPPVPGGHMVRLAAAADVYAVVDPPFDGE